MDEGGDGCTRYFVQGLPLTVTDEDLNAYFSGFGTVVKASIVKDKGSDTSRGFGYVTLADAANRDLIVTSPHEIGGTSVRALLTKDHLEASDAPKVHIDGLTPGMDPDVLREAFSQFGVVLDVHRPKDFLTGDRKRFGFVTFSTDEASQAALSAGKIAVGDSEVSIKPATQVTKGGGGAGCAGVGKGGCGTSAGWSGCGGGCNGHGAGKGPAVVAPPPPPPAASSKVEGTTKYFLQGLDASVRDEDLRAHFSKYGAVADCSVVMDKATSVSRGFGYVTMTDDSVRDTILNDKHEICGHQISVMLTKDSISGSTVHKVHVGKLREDIPAETVRAAMSTFGTVLDVHTPKDAKSGNRFNYAFVTFSTADAYDACMSSGTTTIDGCTVTIKAATQSKSEADASGWGPYACGGGKGYDKSWPSKGKPSESYWPQWGWDGCKGKGYDAWAWGGPGKGYDSYCKGGYDMWGSGGQSGGGGCCKGGEGGFCKGGVDSSSWSWGGPALCKGSPSGGWDDGSWGSSNGYCKGKGPSGYWGDQSSAGSSAWSAAPCGGGGGPASMDVSPSGSGSAWNGSAWNGGGSWQGPGSAPGGGEWNAAAGSWPLAGGGAGGYGASRDFGAGQRPGPY